MSVVTVREAWHQLGSCHRGESAPPSELNYRVGGGRVPAPEKEQGFSLQFGDINTYRSSYHIYSKDYCVCVLDGNSPYIATRHLLVEIHFCTSENVLDRSGQVWILGFPRLVIKHM